MSSLLVVGAVGSTIILATVAEKKLLNVGKHVESEMIHDLTRLILSLVTVGSFFWVLWQLVQKFLWGMM
ncbi:hypothetical protein ACKA0G_10190 [Priestia megaterium]|uniref:hypothetical protein n=1 Tax=Priestia megaterium TaxID=1404 RepID=UPI0038A14320